jgi:serine/threonine protein kinase
LNFPITPIQTYRKDLPKILVDFVSHALEKDIIHRYQTWEAFIEAFAIVAKAIRESDDDLDLYRGFSMNTQNVISYNLSTSRQFSRSGYSRSGFSRSTMPRE